MKQLAILITGLFCCICLRLQAQTIWQPAALKLPTRWSDQVSPANALKEYPRPQMVRHQWQNLNGLWEYAITENDAAPEKYDGQILVPFPLESALSGVQKRLAHTQYLWYKKKIAFKRDGSKKTLLHFGAVDNEATVYVNGKEAGRHEGGYTSFYFDISNHLKDGDNEMIVKVSDPTDQGVYPHGKQVSDPGSIYYTPSSGIWQTVWVENVPEKYISSLKCTPDIDKSILHITVAAPSGYTVAITASAQNRIAGTVTGKTNSMLKLRLDHPTLWTPAHPFLYDLQVRLIKAGKTIDEVNSYFGMRKVSVGKDSAGFYRIFLNNQYVFNLGVLDQGFWPDGLYTAPTDEALQFDIEAIKAMGFNTIRKHIKIEPARWYYHADQSGMLVWQDFVNPNRGLPEGAKAAFEKQLNETINQLHHHPSIITWVLFNEKWGRFDQQRLTEYIKQKDPSRLLNAHSGERLYIDGQLKNPSPDAWVASDIADVHSYPDPMNAPAKEGRIQILGEFGGIGVFIPGHQWLGNTSWGYMQVTPSQLLGKYTIMNQHLQLLEKEGLAGAIYTQPFDVEGEENGLMTYDREVIKMPLAALQKIHAPLNKDQGTIPDIRVQDADLTDPGMGYSRMLQEYVEGKRDAAFLKKLALMAVQAGDKKGTFRISTDYIAELKIPLTEEDIRSVSLLTQSTKDAGFTFISDHAAMFQQLFGEKQFNTDMMNRIYVGEIKSMVDNNACPDWAQIEKQTEAYGAPGEEIVLRTKTLHYFNRQDWDNYIPVATAYLKKYGSNIKNMERKWFQDAIDQHNK